MSETGTKIQINTYQVNRVFNIIIIFRGAQIILTWNGVLSLVYNF